MQQKSMRIAMWILRAIIIIGMTVLYGYNTWGTPEHKIIALYIIVGIDIMVIVVAMIFMWLRIREIEKSTGEKTKFEWKSLLCPGYLIQILRPSATLFLFGFISSYGVINYGGHIPAPLNIDFIILSATLGGLVLTAASLKKIKDSWQKQLTNIAKLFILAAFLFIIFVTFYSLLNLTNFKPQDWQPSNLYWWETQILFVIFIAGGILGGAYAFSKALVDLVALLYEFDKAAGAGIETNILPK